MRLRSVAGFVTATILRRYSKLTTILRRVGIGVIRYKGGEVSDSMHMSDWIITLDSFMTLNDRDILSHAGKISYEMAKQLAESEYEVFHTTRIYDLNKRLSDLGQVVGKLNPNQS